VVIQGYVVDKDMNEESRASDAAFARLIEHVPVLVYRRLYDEAQTFLFVSHGCEQITGYGRDGLLSNRGGYRALIKAADRSAVWQEIDRAVFEKRSYRLVCRISTADEQEKWVQEEGRARYTEDGRVEALEGIITDYSEQMADVHLLEQRVADRTRRLAALYDILEAASAAGSLQSTLVRILARVLRAVGAASGVIHLLDEGGTQLQLIAQQGLPDALLEDITSVAALESPLAGWVAQHGEPLVIPQFHQDARAAALAAYNLSGTYIGVPILASERVYGVLSVLAEGPTRFTAQDELDLLLSVGEQIGVVVENARLHQQAEQLMISEERNRLARELHDSVTQSLYSVTLFAEAGRRMLEREDLEQAAVYLSQVAETSRQSLKEMRLLVHRLRPSVLAEEGLVRAIQHRLSAVEGRAGIMHRFSAEENLDLDPALEEALYYIAQEALNNALKHAMASEVVIDLLADETGAINLRIADNGRGFDLDAVSASGGLGLTSIRERAEIMGGTVTYRTARGKGTVILARFENNAARSSGARPQQARG
jgi:PAS domain S-box-containing protein